MTTKTFNKGNWTGETTKIKKSGDTAYNDDYYVVLRRIDYQGTPMIDMYAREKGDKQLSEVTTLYKFRGKWRGDIFGVKREDKDPFVVAFQLLYNIW